MTGKTRKRDSVAAGKAGRAFLDALSALDDVKPNEFRVAGAVVGLLTCYGWVEDLATTEQVAQRAHVSESTARRMLRKLSDRAIGFTYTPGRWKGYPSLLSLKGSNTPSTVAALQGSKGRAAAGPSPNAKGSEIDAKGSTQAEPKGSRSALGVTAPEKYRETESAKAASNGRGRAQFDEAKAWLSELVECRSMDRAIGAVHTRAETATTPQDTDEGDHEVQASARSAGR